MFDRFTDRARKSMTLARQAAQAHEHDFIGPGHVLIGLLSIPDGTLADILQRLRIDAAALRAEVEAAMGRGRSIDTMGQIPFTPSAKRCLELALAFAQRRGDVHIGTEHLLAGVAGCGDKAVACLAARGIDPDVISRVLDELPAAADVPRPGAAAARAREPVPTAAAYGAPSPVKTKTTGLDAFTADARGPESHSSAPPFVPRRDEMDRLLQVLARATHANAVLVGPAGAGKTALVTGLAHALAGEAVPSHLTGARVLVLDLPKIAAGTPSRGQFEERMLAVVFECRRAGDVLLAIDGLGQALDAGRSRITCFSAADILRTSLSNGDVQCVATATPEDLAAVVKDDPALARRFQVVRVGPMSRDATIEVVRGVRPQFEERHHVRYDDGAVRAAVDLAAACIRDRCLPGSAVDVLDDAGTSVWAMPGSEDDPRAPLVGLAHDWVQRRDAASASGDTEAVRAAAAGLAALRKRIESARRGLRPRGVDVPAVVAVVAAISGLTAAAVRERLPDA